MQYRAASSEPGDHSQLGWNGEHRPGARDQPPCWECINAVRDGRVVAVNEILLNAPGPNLVEGTLQVRGALYPDEPAPSLAMPRES